jgi:DNA-binding transcriptional LysR family regulator
VHGSVAAAAGALHLTPPAVSQQLMVLERERIAAQLRQAERDLAELTGQAGQRHDPAGQEGHDFLGARWRAVAQD